MTGASVRDASQALSFSELADTLGLGMAYVLEVSADGRARRFLTLGETCREITGVDRAAALVDAMALYRLFPEQHRALLDDPAQASEAAGPFGIETELQLDSGEKRWVRMVSTPQRQADGATIWQGLMTDITERRAAEARHKLVLGEVAHRAKNGLAVMMGIVSQTARTVTDVQDFERQLLARLKAMAESQDLVTAAGGGAVSLAQVVDTSISAFDPARFDQDQPLANLRVSGGVAVAMGLLLHELATNAVKYGALSTPGGRVAFAWAISGPEQAELHWSEHGGPAVAAPSRKGFGSRVLEVALRDSGGGVDAEFLPAGFQARMWFPISRAGD